MDRLNYGIIHKELSIIKKERFDKMEYFETHMHLCDSKFDLDRKDKKN